MPRIFRKQEAEGGCGVLGVAANFPVAGACLLDALRQMRNRGNGKGGGVAMVGLEPQDWGVSLKILEQDYLLEIAYLDSSVREDLEKEFIRAVFDIDEEISVEPFRDIASLGLEVAPPEVRIYFVRPKESALREFARTLGSSAGAGRSEAGAQAQVPDLSDELVYQNSFRLNLRYYASLGEKKAFVLSHGKNMLNFKIVGYGHQVLEAYGLKDKRAHVWIGHHRYPTKGKVWHPGGAHPFIGLHEALVHNGDFANYASLCDSLAQRNIRPLFLTDTEVGALLFDLLRRTYGYPLEYVIEALAPTSERDFEKLPVEKQQIYKRLQQAHIHGSPDGPWFFILASHSFRGKAFELIGITDTSMLRPQVFALQHGPGAQVGAIASEKQAIDALFYSLYEDKKVDCPVPDLYWRARGGSYTDGGAFVFSVVEKDGKKGLTCRNKFGQVISAPSRQESFRAHRTSEALEKSFLSLPLLGEGSGPALRMDWNTRDRLKAPSAFPGVQRLVMDAAGFPAEGEESMARMVVEADALGWEHLIVFRVRGQRFIGCGLCSGKPKRLIEVYGSSGDYLASGLDGGEIRVHAAAQDQVGNILKSGRLVIYGDVGQTFLYAAKGGEIFVLGSAAGRPLINAVGNPRVLINGSALDYLAESFMAGDPLEGGGFVILNGIRCDPEGPDLNKGAFVEMETPYPGGNLFSLASGGAVYVRDPRRVLEENQLHGGRFAELTERDWKVIRPMLEENERLFGISLERLLTVEGQRREPSQVYRKIEPAGLRH